MPYLYLILAMLAAPAMGFEVVPEYSEPQEAIQVTPHITIVGGALPAVDAVDDQGRLLCWYMIDLKRDLKAMVSATPRDVDSAMEPGGFLADVIIEMGRDGGVSAIASKCIPPDDRMSI